MKVPLSERVRPASEVAPWVHDEIVLLEKKNARLWKAVILAVDLTERDVIRVRPSDRQELEDALRAWNAALREV